MAKKKKARKSIGLPGLRNLRVEEVWSLAGSLTDRADGCPEAGGFPTTTTGADDHAREELHYLHFLQE
jgi:hypothetical protein